MCVYVVDTCARVREREKSVCLREKRIHGVVPWDARKRRLAIYGGKWVARERERCRMACAIVVHEVSAALYCV